MCCRLLASGLTKQRRKIFYDQIYPGSPSHGRYVGRGAPPTLVEPEVKTTFRIHFVVAGLFDLGEDVDIPPQHGLIRSARAMLGMVAPILRFRGPVDSRGRRLYDGR